MADPITHLTIQDVKIPGPIAQEDWVFHPTDLNASVGGDYIYVGWRRDPGRPPITSLDFKAYDKAQRQNPEPGWNWNPTDLNREADGKFIYMFWKTGESGRAPITDLMVLQSPNKHPPAIDGWVHTGVDLNKGAGGDYIWAYYSTVLPRRLKSVERPDAQPSAEAARPSSAP